ncbi:MAG TPA: lysylphosphatidylglycerol synthase transmembrane domain-containing protein [Thermodesulfovibrionales bacterium]|nr:lysylphosphatidylglycerol synthase transmembrane domain-containing protein [Thermodesulfovibrionales bacterium]
MVRASNKILIFALKLAVSGISLFLIFRKTDIEHVAYILRNIGMPSFLVVSAIYFASQFVSTVRWRMLMPDKFPVMKLFSLYMIGSFFSTFLPGLIGGDAIRAYYLNKDAKKISTTLASVFMDRYVGFVSLMIIGIAAFPFSLGTFAGSPYRWLMPAIFCSFVMVSIFFFGLQLGKRFRVMTEFYDYFSLLRGQKAMIGSALALSAIIQVMNFFMVIMLAWRMELQVSLLQLAVFLPIVITVSSLPISISGIGVREGAFVILLGLIGIRAEAATSLSLSWFFSVVMGSFPGLAFYMFYDRQKTKA